MHVYCFLILIYTAYLEYKDVLMRPTERYLGFGLCEAGFRNRNENEKRLKLFVELRSAGAPVT